MKVETIKGTDGAELRVGDRCDARGLSRTSWRRGRILKIENRYGRVRARIRWKYGPDLLVESRDIRARKRPEPEPC